MMMLKVKKFISVIVVALIVMSAEATAGQEIPDFILIEIEDKKVNFFLLNEKDAGVLSFRGDSLKVTHDEKSKIPPPLFKITGKGLILYKKNQIQIHESSIKFNGDEVLLGDKAPNNYVIDGGKITEGYIRTFE